MIHLHSYILHVFPPYALAKLCAHTMCVCVTISVCSSVSATWLTEEAGGASGTLEEVTNKQTKINKLIDKQKLTN